MQPASIACSRSTAAGGRPLLRRQHGEPEPLRAGGHAIVVCDETVEPLANLECGGEMECVERAQCHRLEERGSRPDCFIGFDDGELRDDSMRLRHEPGHRTADRPYHFHLDDRTRDLVRVACEQIAQRGALPLLDD